jgi:hypothetical protein
VSVSEGKASLHNPEVKALAFEPFFFNIDFCCEKNKEGVAKFYFGNKGSKGVLETIFLDEHEGIKQLVLSSDDLACESLVKVIKSIFPEWTVCDLTSGVFKGNMHVTLPVDGSPYIQGHAAVRNLAFCHPMYEGEFQVPELTIDLSPQLLKGGMMATVGRMSLSKSSTITFAKQAKKCWAIEVLGGGCSFQDIDQVTIDLEAMCQHAGETRLLRLDGGMEGLISGKYALKMNCRFCEEDSKNDTILHLAAHGNDKKWDELEFDCAHLTKSEFDFIHNIAKKTYPELPSVDFNRGTINMVMQIALKQSKFAEINIQSFAANQLDLSSPTSWALGAQHASGSAFIDCASVEPLKTLSADVVVENALFSMASSNEAVDERAGICACCFSGLQGRLTMQHGEVKKSFIEGVFSGLKGRLEIDDHSVEDVIRFEYEGDINTFAGSLPDTISHRIKKTLSGERVKVVAQVKSGSVNGPNLLQVTGKVFLIGHGHIDNEMSFGFNLNKNFGASLGVDVDEGTCWWSVARSCIKDGWFDAENVALEKFVSPFIFQQDQIRLSGSGLFHGTFDGRGVLLQYNAQDLILENADFCIEIKSLSQPDSLQALPANYFIDFGTLSGKGSVPIRNGTYFEKNSGLLFTDVNTTFNHEEGFGHMPQI